MDSPFQNLYSSGQPWIELERGLAFARSKLPTTDWMPTVDRPTAKDIGETEKEQIRIQLAKPFQQNVGAYMSAIEHFVAEQRWPEDISGPAVYYLHLAFLHSQRFVRATCVGDTVRPLTIFPFPPGEPATVVLWLLSEWWHSHGLREYVEEATTDSAVFHRFFA